jgi:hypothetical protein
VACFHGASSAAAWEPTTSNVASGTGTGTCAGTAIGLSIATCCRCVADGIASHHGSNVTAGIGCLRRSLLRRFNLLLDHLLPAI